jgi:hypothetical protein
MAGYQSIGLALGGQRAQVSPLMTRGRNPSAPIVLCMIPSRCHPRAALSMTSDRRHHRRNKRPALVTGRSAAAVLAPARSGAIPGSSPPRRLDSRSAGRSAKMRETTTSLHRRVGIQVAHTTQRLRRSDNFTESLQQLVAAAASNGLDDLGFQVRHRRSRTAGFAGDPGQAHRPGTSALPGRRSQTGNLGAGAVWLRLWPCCHRVVTAG